MDRRADPSAPPEAVLGAVQGRQDPDAALGGSRSPQEGVIDVALGSEPVWVDLTVGGTDEPATLVHAERVGPAATRQDAEADVDVRSRPVRRLDVRRFEVLTPHHQPGRRAVVLDVACNTVKAVRRDQLGAGPVGRPSHGVEDEPLALIAVQPLRTAEADAASDVVDAKCCGVDGLGRVGEERHRRGGTRERDGVLGRRPVSPLHRPSRGSGVVDPADPGESVVGPPRSAVDREDRQLHRVEVLDPGDRLAGLPVLRDPVDEPGGREFEGRVVGRAPGADALGFAAKAAPDERALRALPMTVAPPGVAVVDDRVTYLLDVHDAAVDVAVRNGQPDQLAAGRGPHRLGRGSLHDHRPGRRKRHRDACRGHPTNVLRCVGDQRSHLFRVVGRRLPPWVTSGSARPVAVRTRPGRTRPRPDQGGVRRQAQVGSTGSPGRMTADSSGVSSVLAIRHPAATHSAGSVESS